MIARSAAEFAAATDRALAREATAAVVAGRLAALLAETPRNWIAIEAVEAVAAERGLALPAPVTAARRAAWDQDANWLATLERCAACTWDAAACSLSEALICNAPVTLTPAGDLMGIGRAAVAGVRGDEFDQVDLALSVIGLGATAATLATGGTSYTLKAGASLLRLARRMGLIPPRLMALVAEAARSGIRWDEVLRLDSLSDPARLIVPEAIAPVAAVAADLGRIGDTLGPTQTLHLLRHVDGPGDSRRLAAAAEALGPRTLGTLEILGKSRLLRLASRISDEAVALISALAGLVTTVAAALAGMVQGWGLRALRRALRARPR